MCPSHAQMRPRNVNTPTSTHINTNAHRRIQGERTAYPHSAHNLMPTWCRKYLRERWYTVPPYLYICTCVLHVQCCFFLSSSALGLRLFLCCCWLSTSVIAAGMNCTQRTEHISVIYLCRNDDDDGDSRLPTWLLRCAGAYAALCSAHCTLHIAHTTLCTSPECARLYISPAQCVCVCT